MASTSNVASQHPELEFLAGLVYNVHDSGEGYDYFNSLASVAAYYTHITADFHAQQAAAYLDALNQAVDLRTLYA